MSQSTFTKYVQPYDEQHTIIPNRLILDKNLTDAGFRFLSYLFSNSDQWKIYSHKTAENLNFGKEKMEKTIKHVIQLGYVRRNLIRDSGKFSHYNYEYHHTPVFLNLKEEELKKSSPTAVLPTAVNTTATNRPLLILKDTHTKTTTAEEEVVVGSSVPKKEMKKRLLTEDESAAFETLSGDPYLSWLSKKDLKDLLREFGKDILYSSLKHMMKSNSEIMEGKIPFGMKFPGRVLRKICKEEKEDREI